MSKKGLIILGIVVVIVLGGGVAYISMQEKQEEGKGNKNVVQQEESNRIADNVEQLDYTSAQKVIEANEEKELRELRKRIEIKMPIPTEENHLRGTPDIFILPTILNGVKCNTIGYNEFFEKYNQRDGINERVKDGEATITSDIIVKIKSIKVDNKGEVKHIEYTKKDNTYTFKIEGLGRYVIDCEFTNDTQASIVFQNSIFG